MSARGAGFGNVDDAEAGSDRMLLWWIVLGTIPGVSRSGSTITAGLARGLDREAAARFSFLLLAPITAGAVLLKAHAVMKAGGLPPGMKSPFLVGICVSAVLGLGVIAFFLRFLRTHSLNLFVIYRVVLGLAVIGLVMAHFHAG